jgi:rhomboid protease GluP
MVSVGASGAIMGLFAAAFIGSFRFPSGSPDQQRMMIRSLRVLIPSLLPLATTASGMHIDYGAHLGGAISAGIVALLLLKAWPDGTPLSRARGRD